MRNFIYRNTAPVFAGPNSPPWNTMYREIGLCARDLYHLQMTQNAIWRVCGAEGIVHDTGLAPYRGIGYVECPKNIDDMDGYQVHFLYDEIIRNRHQEMAMDLFFTGGKTWVELHKKKTEYERVDLFFEAGSFRTKDIPRVIEAMGFVLKRGECWYKTGYVGIGRRTLTIRLRYPKQRDTFYPSSIT